MPNLTGFSYSHIIMHVVLLWIQSTSRLPVGCCQACSGASRPSTLLPSGLVEGGLFRDHSNGMVYPEITRHIRPRQFATEHQQLGGARSLVLARATRFRAFLPLE